MDNSKASMTIEGELAQNLKAQNQKNKIIQIVPIIVLIGLILFFVAMQPSFLSASNIRSLLNQLAIPLILALGITFVILMGSIDLSIEGVMGMAASFVALFVTSDKMIADLGVGGMILPVVLCGAIGGLSGLIHVKGKIPSFMVTFAMSSIAGGLGLLSYQGVPANISYEPLKTIANGDMGGVVPYTFIIAMAVFVIMLVIQRWTSFGRYVYAVGDNEMIPRLMGVKVDKVKIMAFVLSGLCIGLAGIIGAGKISRGTIAIGSDQLFPAMTAVVVGGTSLSGGKGGVVNTLLGAVIVTILQNGLIMLGVDSMIQKGIQGLIILGAVAMTVAGARRQVDK